MTLAAGTQLGPYEIVAPLGSGGMGEVYRAKDTRLDREVAIKVLPEKFSRSDELRQRFEREAKAISNLTHPNICTLYDVGRQDGVDYLVMEYLEGETLSEWTIVSSIAAGIQRFLIVLGYSAERVQKHYEGIAARREWDDGFVTADDWKLGNGTSTLAAEDKTGNAAWRSRWTC
ncbi:MAG: protein kinase [Planctomycetes bacterium]|nr:protein kinase [Planctomycetota bacterium]